MRTLFVAFSALLVAGEAQAVTIVNGGFEDTATSQFLTLSPETATTIPGWSVGRGGVVLVSTSAANHSVQLSDSSGGQIVQRLTGLTPGKTYSVSFDVGGGGGVKRFIVSATGGDAQLFSYLVPAAELAQSAALTAGSAATVASATVWQKMRYVFVASGTTQQLQFLGLNRHDDGALIDNIAITSVPEPGSWAMLLAGMGLIGLAARRRAIPIAA